MATSSTRYDKIGIGYDSTRRADPYLAQRMYSLLKVENKNARYLDVGCGTGNYTHGLNQMGMHFTGLEPSDEMLEKARIKNSAIEWVKGSAEDIPLRDHSFDGVLISLSIHHWKDIDVGFSEVARVLKPGGKLVLFTTLPEQTGAYWLSHYFPTMIEDSTKVLPPMNHIKKAFKQAGLDILEQEPYFVKPNLQDWFLQCGKHNPEMYFREDVRRGISSFSLISKQEEVKEGLIKLRQDIDSGKVLQVMKDHDNNMGDYLFLVAKKL